MEIMKTFVYFAPRFIGLLAMFMRMADAWDHQKAAYHLVAACFLLLLSSSRAMNAKPATEDESGTADDC